MRTAPEHWNELLNGEHITETRVDIGGVSYYGYDGESGIWSLTTHNALFENFSVGNCHSGTIDLTLVNPQSIPKMAKMEVYVRLVEEWIDPELFELDEIIGSGVNKSAPTNSTVRYSSAVKKTGDTLSLPENAGEITVTADNTGTTQAVLRGKFFEFVGENRVYYGSPELSVYYFPYYTPVIRFTPSYFPSAYTVKPFVHHRTTDWVRKGVYYIDTREWDAQHEFLTITGFDAMLKAEQPYIVSEASDPVILEEFTIPKGRIKGDVNGNGEVDTDNIDWEDGGRSDRVYVLATIQRRIELSDLQFWCADVNGSGGLTAFDAGLIAQRANGDYNAYTNLDYYNNWTWRDATHNWTTFAEITVPTGATLILPDGFSYEAATGGVNIFCANPPLEEMTAQVAIFGWPRRDSLVALEIAMRIGVELDSRNVLDKGYMVQLPAVSSDGSESMTLREVLGYVGAMYGGNWVINDEGKLQLVPLQPSGTAIDIGTDVIDVTSSPAYDEISRVRLVLDEETEYTAGDDTGRTIEIVCPWGTQAMTNALLTALSGYAYQPIEVTTATKADPLWELGDGVSVNGIYTQIVAMPTYFGLAYTVDVSAPNGEEINHEYPFVDKAQQEIKRTVARATASLRVDVDNITSRVEDAEGNISTVTQTVNGITISDGQGQTLINGAKIKTGTISADSIELTGAIKWGDLTGDVQQTIYAQGYTPPGYIKSTYIDFSQVQSPKIVTNQLDLYARTSSGGSSTGTFNMYGYWNEVARSILQIGYYAGSEPYVTFGSSTFGAYSMWSFPLTYIDGNVEFLQGSKVNNLQFASSDYGSTPPTSGFEGRVFFVI